MSRVPKYVEARIESGDLAELVPTEYRADAVVVLAAKDPVLAVVVEVQRGRDVLKRWSWPVYLAGLRARMRCPAALLVICSEPGIATWCSTPIELGHPGWVLRPLVVGPDAIPVITDVNQAADAPELAVLSAIAHGTDTDKTDVLDTLHAALTLIDDEQARLYADIVLAVLPEAARRHLEALMMTGTYEYQSDFAKKFFAEGRAEGEVEGEARGEARGEAKGEAKAIIEVLTARGIPVPEDARARILTCTDLALLGTWIRLAATTDSIDALFG